MINTISKTTNGTINKNISSEQHANLKPKRSIVDNRPEGIQLQKLKNVIQNKKCSTLSSSRMPLMLARTKVKITNTRTNTVYDGESGNRATTTSTLGSSVLGNYVRDNLYEKLGDPGGMSHDQYDCAEPHAFSQFVDDDKNRTRNFIPDLKTSKVGDPTNNGSYIPPCGWCKQWIGLGKGHHNIKKWFRPQQHWLQQNTTW